MVDVLLIFVAVYVVLGLIIELSPLLYHQEFRRQIVNLYKRSPLSTCVFGTVMIILLWPSAVAQRLRDR